MTTVTEAVESRRSIRAFLERPVRDGLVADVLRRAARAPSGGNLQPWIVTTLEGERMAGLRCLAWQRTREAPLGTHGPSLLSRRPQAAAHRPGVRTGEFLCTTHSASTGRMRRPGRPGSTRTSSFFSAPFGILFLMERSFGPPQWLVLGIFMQTVRLLLREADLDSCPQADWAMFGPTVTAYLGTPPDLALICGMAVGFRDPAAPINAVVTERDDPLLPR